MKDADLYAGVVSPEKQAEYHDWLVDKYGPEARRHIEEARAGMAGREPVDHANYMEELRQIETGLAEAMQRGVPAQATALDPLIERHRDWVAARWARPVTPEAYAGLADIYVSHPDFIARYEQIVPGFADYIRTAMQAWVRRQH